MAFDNVFRIYNQGNFQIKIIHADPEFKTFKNDFLDIDIELNCASAQEHIPEVERRYVRSRSDIVQCSIISPTRLFLK